MSSLPRRIIRKFRRSQPDYEPPQQIVKKFETHMGLYHPTRGWRRMSFARYALLTNLPREGDEECAMESPTKKSPKNTEG